MPTFIKAGYWLKKKNQLLGELNLDRFVQEIINNIPVTTTTTTTAVPEYKVYIASIFHSTGQAPVTTVHKNTMINPVTVVRDFAGQYSISCNDFLYSKTYLAGGPRSLVSTNNASGLVIQSVDFGASSGNKIFYLTNRITTSITAVGTLTDSPGNYFIEIRVYP